MPPSIVVGVDVGCGLELELADIEVGENVLTSIYGSSSSIARLNAEVFGVISI